jgi:MIP family channel proteins
VLHVKLDAVGPELAEAFATFALVVGGCGAIVADARTGALGGTGVALAFAAVIAVMVYATGHVSGAHINPAITVGFAATGHFPWKRVPGYVAAQCLGAVVGGGLLRWLVPASADLGATAPLAGFGLGQALVVEIVATGFLAFVIASVATDARATDPEDGLAIGLAVGLGALFAGPLTGGSMNPARSLGPALASGQWAALWLYVVGPVVGALAAMGFYEAIRPAETPEPEAAETGQPATATGEVSP